MTSKLIDENKIYRYPIAQNEHKIDRIYNNKTVSWLNYITITINCGIDRSLLALSLEP
jgi:hypothetical protein